MKAISSRGHFRDVKGIRMGTDDVEATVNGVKVFAHIKALPQPVNSDEDLIRNTKAVDRDGGFLCVKAISPQGAQHDRKGLKFTSDQQESQKEGAEVRAHVKALPSAE